MEVPADEVEELVRELLEREMFLVSEDLMAAFPNDENIILT